LLRIGRREDRAVQGTWVASWESSGTCCESKGSDLWERMGVGGLSKRAIYGGKQGEVKNRKQQGGVISYCSPKKLNSGGGALRQFAVSAKKISSAEALPHGGFGIWGGGGSANKENWKHTTSPKASIEVPRLDRHIMGTMPR